MSTEPISSSSPKTPPGKNPPGTKIVQHPLEERTQKAAQASWGFASPTFASARRSSSSFQSPPPQRSFAKASSDSNLTRKPKPKKSSASDSPPLKPSPEQPQEPLPAKEEQKQFDYDPEKWKQENARLRARIAKAKQPSVQRTQSSDVLASLDSLPQQVAAARRLAAEKSSQRVIEQYQKGQEEIAKKYPDRPPVSRPAPPPAPPSVSRESLLSLFTPSKQSLLADSVKEMKKANDRLLAKLEAIIPEKMPSAEDVDPLPPQQEEEENLPLCLDVHTLITNFLRKNYTAEETMIRGHLVRITKIEATEDELLNLPSLEYISWLELQECAITDLQLHILCEKLSPNLERASLLLCPELTDIGLNALHRFSQLKYLLLDASGAITSKGISQLLEKCTQLEKVALIGITVDDSLLKSLTQLQVQTLNLSRSNITMEHLHAICGQQSLKKLLLEQCLVEGRQMTAEEMQGLQQKHRNVMILCDETALLDPAEKEIGPPLTIESLKEMLGERPNKTVVYNPHTEQSTYVETLSASQDAIAALPLSNRRKLHLVGVAITDKQLQALPLRELETVLIYNCPNITQEGIASLTGLKRFGTDIPITNLDQVVDQSPQLQRLAVPAASLTARASERLAGSSVKTLEISSTETLAAETLVAAAPGSVKRIKLFGPRPFSVDQIQRFQEYHPNTDITYLSAEEWAAILAESAQETFPDQPSPEPLLSLHSESGSEPDLDQISSSLSYHSDKSLDKALSKREVPSEEEEKRPVIQEDPREYYTGVTDPQEMHRFASQMPPNFSVAQEGFRAPPLQREISPSRSSRTTTSHQALPLSRTSPVEEVQLVNPNHPIFLSNVRIDAEKNQRSLTFFPFLHEFVRNNHLRGLPRGLLRMDAFQLFLPQCNWEALISFYKEKILSHNISFEELGWVDTPSQEEVLKIENLKKEKARLEGIIAQESSHPNAEIEEGMAAIASLDSRIFEETIKIIWKDVVPNLVKLEKTKAKLKGAADQIYLCIQELLSYETNLEEISWTDSPSEKEIERLEQRKINPDANIRKTEERINILGEMIRIAWKGVADDLARLKKDPEEVRSKRLNPNLCIYEIAQGIATLNTRIREDLVKKLEIIAQAVSNLDRVFNERKHEVIDPQTGEEGLAELSIDQFKEEGARIRNFKKLCLSGLKLTWIPHCIYSATWSQLEEVELKNNLLVSLPQKCFYLAPMKNFDASHNFIKGFGEELGMLWEDFDIINLQRNQIEAISPTFQLLQFGRPKEPLGSQKHPKTHLFDLRGNPLAEMPEGFPNSDITVLLGPLDELP